MVFGDNLAIVVDPRNFLGDYILESSQSVSSEVEGLIHVYIRREIKKKEKEKRSSSPPNFFLKLQSLFIFPARECLAPQSNEPNVYFWTNSHFEIDNRLPMF